MRPLSLSPRAAVLLGALSVSVPTAVPAVALAQQPAPAAAAGGAGVPASSSAPPAAAAAVKTASSVRVGARTLNVRAGRVIRVRGVLRPGRFGRVVTLERQGRGGWATIDKARTTRGGRFALRFRTRAVDTAVVRVRFAGDGRSRPASRVLGRMNVFRLASASWYGPGLYGNRLGCGGTLGPGTLGVAHKTLPCGSLVTLRHGGRTVRVPVIDRGPFVGGREFDLTAATKQRLGFGSTGTILVAA